MMYGRPEQPQQWSVHAEFTISHDGINDSNAPPQTHTQQDENGVRMVYSWTSQPPTGQGGNQRASPSTSGSQYSANNIPTNQWPTQNFQQPTTPTETEKPIPGTYGFQRGNMLFTSSPPQRRPCNFPEGGMPSGNSSNLGVGNKLGLNVQDSGYSSDLLSPNSYASSTLPRRQSQPYNRRCRSTCSIMLSTAYNDPKPEDNQSDAQTQNCGRTHSLRCQTPTLHRDRRDSYYGCGDPWCHHANYGEDFCSGRFSPVPENEEYNTSSTKRPSRASTFNHGTVISENQKTGPSYQLMPHKDACVQTFEMVDKCTSPFMKSDNFNFQNTPAHDVQKKERRKKRTLYNSRRKTEPVRRIISPTSFTPDSLESQQSERRLMRSPAKLHDMTHILGDNRGSNSDTKSTDPTKKPRTVHIDVYCTGTEIESDTSSSSSDSENKTGSSPQTVFESGKVLITHKRADDDSLPQRLQNSLNTNDEGNNFEIKDESDIDDGISTAYPSQMSSFSQIRDYGSSLSSVPPSWSTYSMSSCAIPDGDYDSVANTSWKDTVSDFESIAQSRSSVAQTESLLFVPRKLSHPTQKSESIDECVEPEPTEAIEIQSKESLHPSDSFEYANSEDRRRIKKMENMWGTNKPWRSPQLERKHLLQQRKLKEYLDKRLKELPKWESKETDSEESDGSEKGWTIIKDDDKKLERVSTIRRTSNDEPKKEGIPKALPKIVDDQGSLSDSGQTNALKSPSAIALKQRLSLDPSLRAPFTIVPGIYTDQRQIAKKFGEIVDVFKKPGHHVGPVKNPDCLCAHCRSYYASVGYRNRARSVGETPRMLAFNWKDMKTNQSAKNIPEKELPFTDF